jgi:heat shock protein HtpX
MGVRPGLQWVAPPIGSWRSAGDSQEVREQRDLIGRDTGLQVRMLLTLGLLGALYVALGAAIFAAGAGMVTMGLVLAAMALGQLWLSEKLALRAMHARVVSEQEAPGLHAIVARLAIQADLPKPAVAVSDLQVPNAFALGRSPKHATVCATTGLLQLLERSELEAVLAHELAHVKNRDVALMTMASFFASVAALVGQMAAFGGFSGRDREGGNAVIVVVLVSLAVYAISYVLMLALSRYREFAADRGAALLTGRPSALAAALLKLQKAGEHAPERDLREVAGMQAFFIVPGRFGGALGRLLSTHPPLEQRVERLGTLEARMQNA